MTADLGHNPGGGCPSLAVLEAFSFGRLPLDSFNAVADHTSSCSACDQVLQDLDDRTDSLIESLGDHLRPDATTGPAPRRPHARPEPDALEGTRLGRYELLERLGAGGMGVVYKAIQERPRRYVAVKVAHRWRGIGDEILTRLSTEVEAVGRLQHPNIIPIYDSGDADGRRYFAMEYAPGGSLATRLREGPLSEREAAELVLTMAQAVAAIHEMGLIHRDLKPANVLIDRNGTPKLADFGLAKFLDDAPSSPYLTEAGAVLGTASNMAPEQARGDGAAIGPAVDVYGLGALLFETLTGQPPFQGESRAAVLHQVLSTPAPRLNGIRSVSNVLEAICLKCLEKSPARRYASAQALADDLGCWLRGEPTVARPPGWWVRHRRRLSHALVGAAALLVVGAGFQMAVRNNPELQWKLLEQKLGQGRPVNLQAENGGNFYYQILSGDDSTKINVAPDGTLTVHTWGLCLIELVRTPPARRFRFQVEVRHEKGDLASEVGVYAAHRVSPQEPLPHSHLVQMAYDDVHSIAELRSPGIPAGAPLVSELNKVHMRIFSWGLDWKRQPWTIRAGLDSGVPFVPRGIAGDRWRKLEIDVSPEEFQGRCDGREVGFQPAPRITTTLNESLAKYLAKRPLPNPHPPLEPQPFDSTGGVGLLVMRGTASFRLATLTPRPDDVPAVQPKSSNLRDPHAPHRSAERPSSHQSVSQ